MKAAPKKARKQWPLVLPVSTTLHSEDVMEEVLEEKLDVRASLSVKSSGAKAERHTKQKERGLLKSETDGIQTSQGMARGLCSLPQPMAIAPSTRFDSHVEQPSFTLAIPAPSRTTSSRDFG